MLTKYRQKIDKIDTKIAKQLCKRYEIVKQIAEIKQQEGIPIFDKKREEDHIRNISDCCDKNLACKTFVKSVFEFLFKKSRDLQN